MVHSPTYGSHNSWKAHHHIAVSPRCTYSLIAHSAAHLIIWKEASLTCLLMCTVAPDTMYPIVSSVRCSPSMKGLPTASTNSCARRKAKGDPEHGRLRLADAVRKSFLSSRFPCQISHCTAVYSIHSIINSLPVDD